MVGYKTILTNTSLPNYDNTATVTYRLSGEKQPTTVHWSKTVKNIAFDAHVYGTNPRELKIIKQYQDDDGSTKTAQGVVFEITYPDGKTVKKTTDAKGIIDLTDLDAGTYMIKEISAPSYLEVSDQTWKYVVSAKEKGQGLIVTDKKKFSMPWKPLTPAKKPATDYSNTHAWYPLTPATKPATDYSNTHAWYPLTPAKKPATDYSNTHAWYPLTPATKPSTETSIPWTPLTPAKEVKPWTPLTPSTKVIPWTDYSNNKSQTVIPWTDYSNNKSKTVIPWTPLVPQDVPSLEPGKRAQDSATPTTEDVIPWTSLTPSTPATSNENQPTTDDSTMPSATTTSETDLAVPEDVPTSSTPQQPVVENTSQPVLATTDRVLPASTIKTDTQENVVRGNQLPQTGNNKNAQLAIFMLGGLLLVASLAVAPKRN
jgi:LPXTG-motif cell wall-anchored protein